MFAQRFRISNSRTVKRLYAKGRRQASPTVMLYVAPNRARSARLAVVCGRKVSAQAVVRNRLKRVARAELEPRVTSLTPRTDYLVVLRPAAAGHEVTLRRELGFLIAPFVRTSN